MEVASDRSDHPFWAKIRVSPEGTIEEWHSIQAHSIEVSAVMKTLLIKTVLGDRLAALIGWDSFAPGHIDRLAALASIHDIGKVNHSFQDRTKGRGAGHVRPLIACLNRSDILYGPLRIQDFLGWFTGTDAEKDEALYRVLMATFAHHGRPVNPGNLAYSNSSLWQADDNRDPMEYLSQLRDEVEQWFPAAFASDLEPFPVTPQFQHAYNGVLTLADWIASDTEFFPLLNGESPPSIPMDEAKDAVHIIGVSSSEYRGSMTNAQPSFNDISTFDPYDIQRACLELPVESTGSLSILESDTGSGKTEAALARFLALYHAGEVDGLYFALPTRSAATQLHGRVHEAVKRIFRDTDEAPPVVQAVPGYLKVGKHRGRPLPDFEVAWRDEPETRKKKRRWAAEHSKRYLAGQIVVGTIDQVFLSTLKIKHSHLRTSSLLRHFLVVDEVHASDSYMTRLLESVLGFHLQAGGHALLMSATLGSTARTQFIEEDTSQIPAYQEAVDQPYPLITYTTPDSQKVQRSHHTSSDYSKTVQLAAEPMAERPKDIASLALDAARTGARILIIRNLVKDCRKTQQALEQHTDNQDLIFSVNERPVPHHSRFAPDDRRLMDATLEEIFGERSQSDDGVVCVATQTVEQSLDIDADFLMTDLAPMDVLLQRLGRLHRDESNPRPDEYSLARTTVLVPENLEFSEWIESNGRAYGPHGFGTVYPDCRILLATLGRVENEGEWIIPDMNRKLVESATHPDKLQEIVQEKEGAWLQHQEELESSRLIERWKGSHWIVDREKDFFAETFPSGDDLDERIKTRLGEEQLQLELDEPFRSPLDETVMIDELTIPERYFDDAKEGALEDQSFANFKQEKEAVTFTLAGESFRYDRMGLSHISQLA